MPRKLMGRKAGMTQRFDQHGKLQPCTLLIVEPNLIVRIKTVETDGYAAVQLGYEKLDKENSHRLQKIIGKPMVGYFRKAEVAPCRYLHEVSEISSSDEGVEVGGEWSVASFEEGAFVDVTGTSKGKGFQGVMKKYNFSGGPGAHGSGFHRRPGSIGMRSTPGICFKGGKRPSRMGNERKTVEGLRVISVDPERNIILVSGSVPGPIGGLVFIRPSVKKSARAA